MGFKNNDDTKKGNNTLNIWELSIILNIILLICYSNEQSQEFKEIVENTKILNILFDLIKNNFQGNHLNHSIPIKKVLLAIKKFIQIIFGTCEQINTMKNQYFIDKYNKTEIQLQKSRIENIQESVKMKELFKLDLPFAITESESLIKQNLHVPFSSSSHSVSPSCHFHQLFVSISFPFIPSSLSFKSFHAISSHLSKGINQVSLWLNSLLMMFLFRAIYCQI